MRIQTNTKPVCHAIVVIVAVLPLLGSSRASADIISVTGAIQNVTPPSSVLVHALESPTAGIVFQERNDHQLLTNKRVSIPGTVGVYDEGSDMRPTDILAGTVVDSHFLHFDTDFGGPTYQGTVQFADPIVGVMLREFALNQSDPELGAQGTSYPTFAARRGLDYGDFNPLDSFTIIDSHTIGFEFVSSNAVDQVRILTSADIAVPEPGTAGVLGLLTVVSVVLLRRRSRSNRATTGSSATVA